MENNNHILSIEEISLIIREKLDLADEEINREQLYPKILKIFEIIQLNIQYTYNDKYNIIYIINILINEDDPYSCIHPDIDYDFLIFCINIIMKDYFDPLLSNKYLINIKIKNNHNHKTDIFESLLQSIINYFVCPIANNNVVIDVYNNNVIDVSNTIANNHTKYNKYLLKQIFNNAKMIVYFDSYNEILIPLILAQQMNSYNLIQCFSYDPIISNYIQTLPQKYINMNKNYLNLCDIDIPDNINLVNFIKEMFSPDVKGCQLLNIIMQLSLKFRMEYNLSLE